METNLSLEQRLKAEDLLSTMYPEMIPTYLGFLAQTDPFPKLRFQEEAQQVSRFYTMFNIFILYNVLNIVGFIQCLKHNTF